MKRWMRHPGHGPTVAAVALASLLAAAQGAVGAEGGAVPSSDGSSARGALTAATQPVPQPAAARNELPPRRVSEKGWFEMGADLAAAPAAASQDATGERSVAGDAAEQPKEAKEPSTEELAKAAQNPVASMISVPFQSNFNFFDIDKKLGPLDYDRNTMGYILNVQPVIPFSLNDEWNLITRTIIPVINQPEIAPGMGSHGGLGDIQFTSFFSPAKPGKVIWGVGPVLQFPTATDQWLGAGKWNAGPSGLVLTMQGPWVLGVLAQNVWSYCGDTDRPYVNQMLINPFVNYNLPKGWYLTASPNITADWHADSDQRWTVPVGGGFGRLFRIGTLPVNVQLASFYNVVHPDFGPTWSVRFQVQFLFPK